MAATAQQSVGTTDELDETLQVDKEHLEPIAVSQSGTSDGTEAPSDIKPKKGRKWYQLLNPLRLQKIPPVPSERTVSREYRANFLSVITFQWMWPLMNVGYLRHLEIQDIWTVNPNRSMDVLAGKLDVAFKRRLERGDTYPLLWAVYETFKVEFWIGGIGNLLAALLQIFAPYTTRYLIAFATDAYYSKLGHGPAPSVGRGIGMAVGITAMSVVTSLAINQYLYRGMTVGGQARAVLINMIFAKAMKLSGRAKAGGKAIESEQKSPPEDGNLELETTKNELLKNKKGSKRGPRVTADAGRGIAGDGRGWSNGRIITLMSVDADRINTASGMFHLIWTAPISIILTLVVLLVNIGYSALSGYALLVIGIPLLTYAIRTLVQRRKRINKLTDQRVSLTQEILQAVRFVKFFGWEKSFLERLREIRKREVHSIQVLLAIRNAIQCVSMSLPTFASMLSFITYALSNHSLTAAPIFSSLALFNSLRMPLNLLPLVIGQVTDAWTAFARIQEFLLAEEQKEDIKWDKSMPNAIEVKNASFTWERVPSSDGDSRRSTPSKQVSKVAEKEQPAEIEKGADDSASEETVVAPFQLTDLTFSAGRNELLAVIGTVGCGKTSLLSALAGDMRMTGGEMKLGASRAFCPQYAWIQNTTVKNNILFGKGYDREWYSRVIDACAMRSDIEMFSAGDQTEIGERGITVSGGQKQRLNIARAIYFDADIVLMDDPLSAVDAHVGRHIMDNAICGLLKEKCRILATHQLHVLSRCDRIILMEEGHINAVDTFDNLMRDNPLFKRLMSTTAQEEKTKKHEESDKDGEVEEETPKTAVGKVNPVKKGALMQQEERAVDTVSWSIWKAYMAASQSWLGWFFVLLTLILTNCANIITSLWLSYWTSNKYNLSTGQYIGIYAGLGGAQAALMYVFSTVMSTCGTNSSKTMLQRAMTKVLRAPMAFFDTTPLGRITNRFSKDIHVMDNELTDAMRIYSITITMIISVMILIIVFYNYFGIALGPLLIIFFVASNYYRASARDMKRHEAVLRSVVFARFGEAISGTACIRAYGLQDQFAQRLREAIDDMNSAYFLTFSNQRWLSIRLDAVGNTMVLVCGILVVTSRFDVSPSISGLVLSYILAIVGMFQFTIRQLAEVENDMNSTERVHYYGTELDEEPPLHLTEVEPSWPQQGRITFTDVQMRYREGLPLVLQGLNMDVRGGERIGIVGRTGAGKSSIMSALFRLTELSGGNIKIDGIDIATVGLHDLRSRLAIIPQDPTLFRGTVRSNLDPFNEHTDLELWSALRKADLVGTEGQARSESNEDLAISPAIESARKGSHRIHLDTPVDEEGLNFSLGQRQLMALSRALVRDSRIIVCDEATSSVDFETDLKIQQTMAYGFKGKTLLCIAHRLRTIIGYDRICVMDQGRIAEMDEPLKLWRKRDGIFRSMCDRSGIKREDFLINNEQN
ncbi:ATP-binding cassette transporter yor1 [Paecilomyces lecythidis]